MARRKHRKSHKRRHRMGATKGANIMSALGVVAGVTAGRLVTTKVQIGTPIVRGAGVLILGMFFPKLMKGAMGESIGSGMIAAGGLSLLQGAGVLGAIDGAIDYAYPMVGAFEDVGAIAYDDSNIGEMDEISAEVDESLGAMDEY